MSMNYTILAAMGMLISIVSGCAVNQVSLTDTNQITVAKQDSEKIKILWTDVYQKDDQTWVYGVLKQRGSQPSAIKTHIDIQILSDDGTVKYETFSKDIYVPRNRVGKGPNWKRFRVIIAENISAGSIINMKVHSDKHENITG